MSWESYLGEISGAKEEYEKTLKPVLDLLTVVQRVAWENYVKRIVQAEILLKEGMS